MFEILRQLAMVLPAVGSECRPFVDLRSYG